MRGRIHRPVRLSMLSGAALDRRLSAVRAENLKLLMARYCQDAAPTISGFARRLAKAGALVTESAIRNCICGKAPLSNDMAKEIEDTMGLPAGWMNADHSYIFAACSAVPAAAEEMV